MKRQKTVLIVDDDDISITLVFSLLKEFGDFKEINKVSNGNEAIQYLNTNSIPDLILLDLDMPIMDGFSFLETFKAMRLPHKEDAEIVILASSNSNEDVSKAKSLGINNYIVKPISVEKLQGLEILR